jgi:hypothetical protein
MTFTQEEWQTLKQKIIEQRINFANTKFGKHYNSGAEVKSPYTQEEVNIIQQQNNVIIPKDLEYYLTNISREIFCNSYPYTFDGYMDGKSNTTIPILR